MDRTIGYIFGSLNVVERSIRSIEAKLMRQNRFNKLVLLGVIFNISSIIALRKCCEKRNKKIEELSEEIDKLKGDK